MSKAKFSSIDGNEAAASVAYRLSELVAIYPITPSTPMGELSDEWMAKNKTNIWKGIPQIVEMQSEAGVAGAIHGMLQGGTLASTFTASQGLLLMIPIMYKLAGQLMPFVLHVSARTVAVHGLSIFGDHSDVMACRQTGFAMLASANPQEAHDMAAIAHAATMRSRVPFLHFFDGFRTSHEINDVALLDDAALATMVPPALVEEIHARALSPDAPSVRGTAQNPDVFFQTREACNPFYTAVPTIVREEMKKLETLSGRSYDIFKYYGAPDAERVIVVMGSGVETVVETVEELVRRGEKVGVVQVLLYRPFASEIFVQTLPKSVKQIAVLDRCKEPGATGEPLYLDVVAALNQFGGALQPEILGGRFALASKEFTPPMVAGIFSELVSKKTIKNGFTVGINDDVSFTSIPADKAFALPSHNIKQAVFFGLGSDGTVGANKNTIKIIADKTGSRAQAYFVYDSKKAGTVTVSHLRFGTEPIRAPYLIDKANFVGCHQFEILANQPVLQHAADGAVFLLNSPYPAEEVWNHISRENQQIIIAKKLKVFVIDAYKVARATGMGALINTIMQTCFFKLSDVMSFEDAIAEIKGAIIKTYSRKGEDVVKKNCDAVDHAIASLFEVKIPATAEGTPAHPVVSPEAPQFVREVIAPIIAARGDSLSSSQLPVDGVWPTDTTKWEKRNLAQEIPVWEPAICIQCNKCNIVCPHAANRSKFYPTEALAGAPETFKSVDFRSKDFPSCKFTIQIAPEDCTGCMLCVSACPAKDKADPTRKALNPAPQIPLRDAERENYAFFLALPNPDRTKLKLDMVKDTQFCQPLIEYSGACVGCGETPYVKLVTQMFGDRLLVANATGCSSIYGGNLPTTPYATTAEGRGPAWANSLFEDNAEFGLGLRMAADARLSMALASIIEARETLGTDLVEAITNAPQITEADIAAQRARVAQLRTRLSLVADPLRTRIETLADSLVQKAVWIIGGDGWAYDIGFGGLDHVLSLGENVNILVLDTEVYSNTGGQASKSTSVGAVAKFAARGKSRTKKDLGMYAMSYGDVYVARVSLGAKDTQTVKAFAEAATYPGTSLIIAYSHCIAHGFNTSKGLEHQKMAVDTGYWPLFRFDPRLKSDGKNPLVLDSPAPKQPLIEFTSTEARYKSLEKMAPERYAALGAEAQEFVNKRYAEYQRLAGQ